MNTKVPEYVQKNCTKLELAVLGLWLDLIVFRVFSKLNDCMIPSSAVRDDLAINLHSSS